MGEPGEKLVTPKRIRTIQKKWAREAAEAADKKMRMATGEGEDLGREARERREEEWMPVVGATPTGRRGKRRTGELPDSLPTKVRLEYSAGWPVGELRDEEYPEFASDLEEEAFWLRRYAEENNLKTGNIDLYATGPELAIEVERAKALWGMLGKQIPKREKGGMRRAEIPEVSLEKVIKTKNEVVEAWVDPARLKSEKVREFLADEKNVNWLVGFWGDENVRVVLYPKTEGKKPKPSRIRLLREAGGKVEDFEMSLSEWELALREKGKQVRFPKLVKPTKPEEEKADWAMMLNALRINGVRFGGRYDNIYFSEETREIGSEIHGLITRANEQSRKEK